MNNQILFAGCITSGVLFGIYAHIFSRNVYNQLGYQIGFSSYMLNKHIDNSIRQQIQNRK